MLVKNNKDSTFVTLRIPELDANKNKVMICGSMDFNTDIKAILSDWGWQEGNNKTAGTFVQEKAFVS